MVPTISFVQLYVLVIVRLARRELVWINVTSHPTAEWIARVGLLVSFYRLPVLRSSENFGIFCHKPLALPR